MCPYGSVDSLVYDHLDQPTVSLDWEEVDYSTKMIIKYHHAFTSA